MKKLFSALLAALLLLTCLHAFAETASVDNEGKNLTNPISGAILNQDEDLVQKLLDDKTAEAVPNTEAVANDSEEYRVFVYDSDGSPIKGAVVQLCDDTTCTLQKTKEDGIAAFKVDTLKVYEIHLLKVPEGYKLRDEVYKTLDTYSDVSIYIEKVE